MNYFPSNLKYLMQKYGYKNITLARELGVTKSTISNYLAGTSEPRNETLVKLAYTFCRPVEILLEHNLCGFTLREPPPDHELTPYYMIPFFVQCLANTPEGLYVRDNFDAPYYFPISAYHDRRCYAVKLYDGESILDAGLPQGGVAIFARDLKTAEGEVAAVYHKELLRILIRRVHYEESIITLTSDISKEVFDIKDKNCPIELLGKVVTTIAFLPVKDDEE